MDCNCFGFDNIIVNNRNYNDGSTGWTSSYLCDFAALREDSAADKQIDNPPSTAQGLSILNDGKYAVVYLINEEPASTPEKTRTELVLIDLQSYKIIDTVERDTATDDTTRYLNHANGATAYTDSNGIEHSVTVWGGFAFDTAIVNGKISAVTTSTQLSHRDTPSGVFTDFSDSNAVSAISLDKATGYWYLGSAGRIYKSTEASFNAIPTQYDYIMATGSNPSFAGPIDSLRRQGCMIVNQSITVKDKRLYATISGPGMFVEFDVDTDSETFGDMIAVHNMDEYNTGYVGLENECIGWSEYLNCWVTVTNGRYADEYTTDRRDTGTSLMLFNHITLWAIGPTVGDNFRQTYTTQDQNVFTHLAGNPRYIYCTLDPEIMTIASRGHKIGEYIRHTGYIGSPMRSIAQALSMLQALKQDTCHQTAYLCVNGDFAKYVCGGPANIDKITKIPSNFRMLLNTDFDLRLVNGSSFPTSEILPNTSITIIASKENGSDSGKDSNNVPSSEWRASIPKVTVDRGSKLTSLQIYIGYLELKATSILNGNAFGACQIMANGQNVISIGGTDNAFTSSSKIAASLVFINGGDSNVTYESCINLKRASTATATTGSDA